MLIIDDTIVTPCSTRLTFQKFNKDGLNAFDGGLLLFTSLFLGFRPLQKINIVITEYIYNLLERLEGAQRIH